MIKVTLEKEKPFPKLMKNEYGCIRLFFNNEESVIVKSVVEYTSDCSIYSKDDKIIIKYTDYNEPITLQNA